MSRYVIGKLIEMTVIDGVPLLVDDAMWVRLKGGALGYLDGNTHTARSGVGVWNTQYNDGALTSLSDIVEMSDASRAWIAGYLHGREPDLSEYLGWDGDETEDEWRRWRALLERYWETGWCPHFDLRPRTPFPMTDELRHEVRLDAWVPWAYAGERVWIEDGERWVEADPQPDVDEWGTLVGSSCDRTSHDLLQATPDWDVCLGCGHVSYWPAE